MTTPAPTVTDHDDFERQLLELRKREKAHTREGDAIAAARRRLPMTEVPPDTTVIGPDGPVPFVSSPGTRPTPWPRHLPDRLNPLRRRWCGGGGRRGWRARRVRGCGRAWPDGCG